ncbi:MarR family winged helix-turn-helix transcriptional regulator [Paenibacillus sp. y28]|uniref:MarR family winged helix-turn-helix transcriptional regulator n=1 Tax=Paenibacillus sp. y28 TaxID=3129110 RepID=UPI0030165018
MDQTALFQKLVAFTSAVYQVKCDLTKGVKSDEITPLQYSILEYIAVSQPVTPSQISDCMHVSMPNTSRELKKLTAKNLCGRFTAADDRRKQYIRLSPEGQALMNESFQQIEARFRQRIKDMSEEELAEISHAFDVLHTKVFHPRT